jgi:hypothetical protein
MTAGCNYQAWIFLVDFQLFLLVPFYVILYKKRPTIGVILHFVIIVVNMASLMWLADKEGFRANYLSTEGQLVFSYIINKPYFHLLTHSVGVLTAFAYYQYLEYRTIEYDEVKRGRHPILHYLAEK